MKDGPHWSETEKNKTKLEVQLEKTKIKLKATSTRSASHLDKISKLAYEKTKLEAKISFLTQLKEGGGAAPAPSEEPEEVAHSGVWQ